MSVERSKLDVERSADSAGNAVDAQNPWIGLASFTEETKGYFYGREEEVAELGRRVQRKLLTILFGQSGLGKTSILRAGIVPRLGPEGYCPVYVRVDYSRGSPSPAEQIKQAVFRATQTSGKWTQAGVAEQGETLWEFLHHRDDHLRDALGKPLIPLLIFDQFEEIFTLGQSDDFGRQRAAQFLEDLADLVENRPPKALEAKMEQDEASVERFDFTRAEYRILIALREDYLAHLEGLKHMMPSVTQNRMRLARMTGSQAITAVVRPGGGLVGEDVAEQIVRFIAGGAELAGAEVEPSLLSLVCRELNNARRSRGQSHISADLLAGSRDTILSEFYERTLADQPAEVRAFIEDELLTDSGYRESIAEERVKKAFTAVHAPGALTTLVDRRLLRVEERLDVRRVELTHDVLCGVVKASRDVRLERESKVAVERQLLETRAKEEQSRRALHRARLVAGICAVLMLLAVGSAVFGWFSLRRARAADMAAQAARQQAEEARVQSEKLIAFLLEDFYEELIPTGRGEIVGQLADKAVAYYDGLSPELMTPQTKLYRGMALVRKASSLTDAGKVADGTQVANQALKIFQELQAAGDKSDEVTTAVALAIFAKSTIAFGDAGGELEKAVGSLRPIVASGRATRGAKLAFADMLQYLAHDYSFMRKPEQGVVFCEESRKILTELGAVDLSDLTAASIYGDVTDTESRMQQQSGHLDEAERLSGIVTEIAEKVLEQRPGDLRAMRNRFYSANMVGIVAREHHDLAKAEASYLRAEATARSYTRFNPADSAGWDALGTSLRDVAETYVDQGRITDSLKKNHDAAALEHDPRNKTGMSFYVYTGWRSAAALEAQLGNVRSAQADLVESARVVKLFIKDRNIDDELSQIGLLDREMGEFDLLAAGGDYATIHRRAADIGERYSKIKKANPNNERFRSSSLRTNHTWLAESALRLGNWEEAAAISQDYIDHPLLGRIDGPNVEVFIMRAKVRLGQALIGAGRGAEALASLGEAVAYYRGELAKGATDTRIRQDASRALWQLALAQGDSDAGRIQRRALLEEATGLLDGLSTEARQLMTSRELIRWVGDARVLAGF